jgi:hypothetical protein
MEQQKGKGNKAKVRKTWRRLNKKQPSQRGLPGLCQRNDPAMSFLTLTPMLAVNDDNGGTTHIHRHKFLRRYS